MLRSKLTLALDAIEYRMNYAAGTDKKKLRDLHGRLARLHCSATKFENDDNYVDYLERITLSIESEITEETTHAPSI